MWVLFAVSILFLTVENTEASDSDFGSLKLCPSGGPSFVYAWNLACEMKRKKRSTSETSRRVWSGEPIRSKRTPEGYRPATFSEIMNICCELGCEIRDLLAYCDPFGSWNSRR